MLGLRVMNANVAGPHSCHRCRAPSASRRLGVDTISGRGISEVADTVAVDVGDSQSRTAQVHGHLVSDAPRPWRLARVTCITRLFVEASALTTLPLIR